MLLDIQDRYKRKKGDPRKNPHNKDLLKAFKRVNILAKAHAARSVKIHKAKVALGTYIAFSYSCPYLITACRLFRKSSIVALLLGHKAWGKPY